MKRAPAKSTWTTKNGEVIKIRDLTDSHLLNIINMLIRSAAARHQQEISAAWSALAGTRGEMAEYYLEQDINRLEDMSPLEFLYNQEGFEQLVAEAHFRKIQKFEDPRK